MDHSMGYPADHSPTPPSASMPLLVPPETLETARLLLRRPEPLDAAAVYGGWSNDPEVVRYLARAPHQCLADAENHIARATTGWTSGTVYTYYLVSRTSGQLLGSITSQVDRNGVRIGYMLRRDCWGQGYLPEALAAVTDWWLTQGGAQRVWATCHPANHGSTRVLEKVGYTLEGTLRRWAVHPTIGPEAHDHLCFSRIADPR